jgi:hypothetical protein
LSTAVCGDGVRSSIEPCEGNDLGGQTCRSLGFYGQEGTGLKCANDCTFDTSGCSGKCGDGVINGPHEECDGAPPPGKTCLDYGYDSGFLGCSELCSPSFDTCRRIGWHSTGPGGLLFRLWGSSSSDVYAVGNGIMHWDGATWSQSDTPSGGTLWAAIWGGGPKDVFVVGNPAVAHPSNATVVGHWDGGSWSIVSIADPQLQPRFRGVWGFGSLDRYAFGEQGQNLNTSPLLYHWDGTTWSQFPFPWDAGLGTGSIERMSGSGPNDLYVLVNAAVWHWDGATWQEVHVTDDPVASIWSAAADDVFATGARGTYHWDGASWSMTAPGGTIVWGTSGTDVYIVGQDAANEATVTHWDGLTWSQINKGNNVDDVWADGLGSVWLLSGGAVSQLGIGRWTETGAVASALCGTGDGIFAFTSTGETSFTFAELGKDGSPSMSLPLPPLDMADSLWGIDANDIWLAGFGLSEGYGVWRWDGTSWMRSTPVSPLVDSLGINAGGFTPAALGGSSSSDVWAMSDVAMHWDGQTWSTPTDVKASVHAVWARSPTDAIAVGDHGAILRWDGKAWNSMDSTVTTNLADVWGTDQDVFAVGDAGVVLHLEGNTNWSRMYTATPAPLDLKRIKGSGSGNVFAADATLGKLLHLRNGAWEVITTPTQTISGVTQPPPPINSLLVTPKRVYIVEAGGDAYDSNGFALWANGGGKVYRLDLTGVTCQSPEKNCDDGWDNDCDGLADGADPDCKGMVTEQCANLVDDDGDGLSDCADPDCAEFPSCKGKK